MINFNDDEIELLSDVSDAVEGLLINDDEIACFSVLYDMIVNKKESENHIDNDIIERYADQIEATSQMFYDMGADDLDFFKKCTEYLKEKSH